MTIRIAAVSLGILFAFSLSACSAMSTPASPASPASDAQRYESVSRLKDAAVAAGYDCTNWSVTNEVASAKESGTCYTGDVFSVYGSHVALQHQLTDYKAQQKVSAESGIQPTAILVGSNWIVSASQDVLFPIASKLHADLLDAPVPSTPSPSVDDQSSPNSKQQCVPIGATATVRILAESWSIVVAAQGQKDEGRYVIDFADEAKNFYEDVKHDDTCDNAALTADAAGLNFEATLLALPFNTEPPARADRDQYDNVRHAAHRVLLTAGVTGTKFVPIDCKAHVGKTPRCTAFE